MFKQSLKCTFINKLFSCFVFYIFLQRIPTIFTYNVSEDYDIEPVEKVDMSPYIHPNLTFLNSSGINVVQKKTERNIKHHPTSVREVNNLTDKVEKLIDTSSKFKEKDLNSSERMEKSSNQIQPRSEILDDDDENDSNFLMKLLFNFYLTPILSFYKPLMNEEMKYYRSLINVSKQFSNDTNNLSSILNNAVTRMNDTNDDSEMTVKIDETELKKLNLSLRTAAAVNFTDFDTENDPALQAIPRWQNIFELNSKDEIKTTTPSQLIRTTQMNSDNLPKEEIFFKPAESPTSTELPKLSFTNNSAIFELFKPGEIPRINVKKEDPKSPVSFKIQFPLGVNNTGKENNTHNDHHKEYTFDKTLETPVSNNSSSLAQEVYNPSVNMSDVQMPNISSNKLINFNESNILQPRIVYGSGGSLVPGMLEITTTTLPSLSFKTASRDHYKSRMHPTFSARYSANSTASRAAVETSMTKDETKNISIINRSLMNVSITNTSVSDSQEVKNVTKSNFFDDKSLANSTVASVSEETTLAVSSEINNDTAISKHDKSLRKRELPINENYDVNDRQELASYFYNGKKIHESYLNYANSIDHEFPQDFVQYQDKLSRRIDSSSFGSEVMYPKNPDNFQVLKSRYDVQQKSASSFDDLLSNPNSKDDIEKRVFISEKEISTMASVKRNNNTMNRKRKKIRKNISNRKKVNSKRKKNRNGKLRRKNNRPIKGKMNKNSEMGKKKKTKTYPNYNNAKVRNSGRKRTRKNKKKISNQARSKKRNTRKQNDKTRFRDLY